ncbi:putative Non ribosomal peptide synthetase [Paraburkholderia ribeironis]|uniref:Putative Non ribosomal peptide synthetase n=1 Tax=Paraburkholderia ribeironis TaxID=1247936 RepID=A0A1N7RUN7_9BURK|nr:non-ribosomal peptide synthetase [Paraburkholderia ribeironis]SIT38826.1 putative Non ribosomal peptide synthetase [Paraburkholderia ribeironis]
MSDVKQALAARLLTRRGSAAELIAPLPPDTPPPLALAQERLWFVDQLAPNTSINNLAGAALLDGALDAIALRKALTAVIARHAPLRSRFVAIDGKPQVKLGEATDFLWATHDFAELPAIKSEQLAIHDIESWARVPFNLTNGPLVRAHLYQLAQDRHLFGLVIHHIACDGWSLQIMMRELAAFYAVEIAGAAPPPPLGISYYDYAAWQRHQFDTKGIARKLHYWQQQFLTLPPPAFPRPDTLSGQAGARQTIQLSSALTEQMAVFCRDQGSTPFMILLAVFKVLLHRWGRETDLCVGTPVANRDRSDIENHIGFFVNLLPLRTDLGGNPSFRTVLARVRATAMAGFSHQDLPFEVLVRNLQPEWQSGWRRLVQVVFAYHQASPAADQRLLAQGLRFAPRDVYNGTALFDLMLSVQADPTGDRVTLEYAIGVMELETAGHLLTAFRTLLADALARPDVPIYALALHDRDSVIREAARGRRQTVHRPDRTLQSAFSAVAARAGLAPAVTCGDKTLSYEELDRRSDRLARLLMARGVKPEERVGLCLERSVELIVALIGILKAGAAYVPMDPAYPPDRLALLIELSTPTKIVTQRGLLADGPELIYIDEMECAVPDTPLPVCRVENAAYVMFTSGSTGTPKGVVVTHGGVLRLFDAAGPLIDAGPDDSWSLFHSISFDFSVWELWGALLHGGRLVVVPAPIARDPLAFRDLILTAGISVLNQTPSAFRGLMRSILDDHAGLNRLRLVIFGGEALSPALLRPWVAKFGADRPKLINMYGITETTVHVTHWQLTERDIVNSATSIIGRPLNDLDLFIVDDQGQPVPPGMSGEIIVGGAGLARGYLDQPGLTAERFIASSLSAVGERLYRTGDLARRLPNGELEFLGRIDHQLKNRGFRVEPGEIEAALREHEGVADCVVCDKPGADRARKLVGYVVPRMLAGNEGERTATISHYREVFDNAYRMGTDDRERVPFNTAGWIHSDSGKAIDAAEMHEWVDQTVARILALSPRSILEIGCGLGLLALPLTEAGVSYLGTDISWCALNHVRSLAAERRLDRAAFELRAADDFSGLASGSVDVVVLNSVIQYFPDQTYLQRVLDSALNLVGATGTVFVGDVPSLPLIRAFHTAVARHRAGAGAQTGAVAKAVRQALADERELRAAPLLFESMVPHGYADIRIKQGRHQNEMTRFRYDVVLYPIAGPALEPERSLLWSELDNPLETLTRIFKHPGEALIEILAVPNQRVWAENLLAEWLGKGLEGHLDSLVEHAATLAEAAGAVDPDAVRDLAERSGYAARIAPSANGGPAAMDLLFSRAPLDPRRPWRRPIARQDAILVNDPFQTGRRRELIAALRAHLVARLPTYMVPDILMPVPALPLTTNGKLDLRALPPPDFSRATATVGRPPQGDDERRLAVLWRALLGTNTIAATDDFWELGGHSLLAARLMFQIETEFGVRLPLMTLFSDSSLGGMASLISQAADSVPGDRDSVDFWRHEARLASDIAPSTQCSDRRALLLTGATGFLGTYLLGEALADDRFEAVYCLVRAADAVEGSMRLSARLQVRGLWRDRFASRLIVVPGDLEQPLLGLSEANFTALADHIGLILHNGCRVNFLEPYDQLRGANVAGTEALLRLACTGPAKPFHYVSSLGVFDDGDMDARYGIFEERRPGCPHTLDDAYSKSKWVAEEMVRTAGERGLPTTVLRPSRIGGHSRTGDCRSDDLLWLVVRAALAVGALPDLDLPLDVVPVDYVARACIAIAISEKGSGRALHLNNPHPPRFRMMAGWLADAGYQLDLLPYSEWRERVVTQARSHPNTLNNAVAVRLEPLLATTAPDDMVAARCAWADCTNALKLLGNSMDPCPQLDGSQIARCIQVLKAG